MNRSERQCIDDVIPEPVAFFRPVITLIEEWGHACSEIMREEEKEESCTVSMLDKFDS